MSKSQELINRRQQMRDRMAGDNRKTYRPLRTAEFNELKAQETLRDMISESDWRKYVTNGYVMVKGQSTKWYQVFRDRRLAVYEGGKKICELCIHSQNCPPTDHVINMKTLLELDEGAVWAGSNAYGISQEYARKLQSQHTRINNLPFNPEIHLGNTMGIITNNNIFLNTGT